jgi:phosphoribosylaminoimidazolecarboxamide formyltransferase/IMP cyclohydrolase
VLAELKDGVLTDATKFALSVAAFNRISQYDGAISDYLSSIQSAATRRLPASPTALRQGADLRYGELPPAGRAVPPAPPGCWSPPNSCRAKSCPYNNIADADAAWECVKVLICSGWSGLCHRQARQPCGVALGADGLEAYSQAFKTDRRPRSAASLR